MAGMDEIATFIVARITGSFWEVLILPWSPNDTLLPLLIRANSNQLGWLTFDITPKKGCSCRAKRKRLLFLAPKIQIRGGKTFFKKKKNELRRYREQKKKTSSFQPTSSLLFSQPRACRTTISVPKKKKKITPAYVSNALTLPTIETRERGYDCYFLEIGLAWVWLCGLNKMPFWGNQWHLRTGLTINRRLSKLYSRNFGVCKIPPTLTYSFAGEYKNTNMVQVFWSSCNACSKTYPLLRALEFFFFFLLFLSLVSIESKDHKSFGSTFQRCQSRLYVCRNCPGEAGPHYQQDQKYLR